MSLSEIFYYISIVGFSFITFMIVLRNFQSKFTKDGKRRDLIDSDEKEKEI